MRRRDLLRAAAGAGALALAGCVSRGPGDADDGTDPSTTPAPPSVVGRELVRSNATCAESEPTDGATVAFGDGRVTVTGEARTPDPCYAAALEAATYDAETDELTVTVGVSDEGGVCSQCVGVLRYEAAIDFDDGLPGTVVVRHARAGEPSTVATVGRSTTQR